MWLFPPPSAARSAGELEFTDVSGGAQSSDERENIADTRSEHTRAQHLCPKGRNRSVLTGSDQHKDSALFYLRL
ncbi:hypothetical protein AALO_G00156370 [Alosa alosa]|uniref:Uncharacterized protein n=1 Tax=Alosa alosa TaxID=278164 RepID=A0AAV6GF92_9TELE|nr:hypothetical protein AALO_G00156370 [Alosa alosa]